MNTLPLRWLAALCLIGATALMAGEASGLRTFTSTSQAELRAANAGRPLVVAFWSTHCEPCKDEIALLARLHRDFPRVPVVLIAADPPADRAAVQRFLAGFDLGKIELRQFGDEAEERIRYSVDPAWHGELPRSYFFAPGGAATGHSGVPDEARLRDWFEKASKSPAR